MRKSMLTVLGAAVALTVAPFVQADDTAELRAELQAMKAELAQIKNEQGENWMNERRAEEVKALVNEALSDADTRATLLQDGAMAGFDGKKFFLQSADGSFRLNIEGQIQFRYVYAYTRDELKNNRQSNDGFELRRVKLKFNGHIGDPKIKFKVTLANNRSDGNTYLEEAVMSYDFNDWLTVYGGRLKAPFAREELVSSSRQLAVDRSYVTEAFTWGWTEGVGVVIQPVEMIKANLMVNDGRKQGETSDMNFDSSTDSHVSVAARVDWLVFGDWKAFKGFNGWAKDDMALLIGGAVAYAEDQPLARFANNIPGLPGSVPSNTLSFTMDGSFKMEGLTVFTAGYAQYSQYYNTGVPTNASGTLESYGVVAQAGYNISDTYEPFVRYEYVGIGHHGPAPNTDGHIATVGMNWFLKGNDAKFTTDIQYFFQPTNEMVGGSSGIGVLDSDKGDQIVFRAQFQLLF